MHRGERPSFLKVLVQTCFVFCVFNLCSFQNRDRRFYYFAYICMLCLNSTASVLCASPKVNMQHPHIVFSKKSG